MNFATIGTNWITDLFIEAARQTKALHLVAVYSRTEQTATEFAEKHGVVEYFTNLEAMAKSESIDVVYIASPNSLHYEQAVLFLKHKKHVICEKPIFSNVKEWEMGHTVAEQNGVFLFESLRNLHLPNYYKLKENMDKVGKVRNVFFHRMKYSSRYEDVLNGEEPNIFSLDYSGGALVDLGVYPLAVAVALFGQPEQVQYSPVIVRTGVDGSGTLVLTYKDFSCTIMCSKIFTSFTHSEIHGEKGTIRIDDMGSMFHLDVIDIHSKQKETIGVQQAENDMTYEIEAFVDIIKTRNQKEYDTLTKISLDVLSITERARKQNHIVYSCERS